VVIARPGTTIDDATARTPELRSRTSLLAKEDDNIEGATRIYLVHAHTRDVSSTTIRQRIAEGRPIDDLVPASVARHIAAHHLYGADTDLHGKGN
jgi:nicotinic acid mononucleotide adenylyltransferase